MSFINHRQRDFLKILIDNPDGRTDKVLRQELKLDSNLALAGVTAALVKNARKVGILKAEEIFKKEVMRQGDEKVLEYSLAEPLREIARFEDLGN
jgi:hypothetical protein